MTSPVLTRLNEYLDALNTGNTEQLGSVISSIFAPTLRDRLPLNERLQWDWYLHNNTGGLSITEVTEATDTAMSGYAQANLTSEWFRIRAQVTPDSPHLLTELILHPSRRPDSAGVHPSLTRDVLFNQLSHLLHQLAEADLFSGAVLVAYQGKPFFQQVYGLASIDYDIPNKLDTKFNLASLCKSLTGVAVGQLVQRGRLSFDDTLDKYLPDFQPDVARHITVHHLLTHTAGLGNYWKDNYEGTESFTRARMNLRTVGDYIDLIRDNAPVMQPGQQWYYSNNGFWLLGAIIERVADMDYYEYMREYIYRPAGMINTDAYEVDFPHPNMAIGYTRWGLNYTPQPGPRRNNLFMHVVKGGPAGGAFSTVEDLLNFERALRDRVLLDETHANIVMNGKVSIGSGNERQYGYGFMISQINGQHIAGHSGTFPGIGTRLDLYMEQGYSVIILSNYDPHIAQMVGNKLREWIAGY
jgi:CubicO group peptidase (beta-lactamase class C family)